MKPEAALHRTVADYLTVALAPEVFATTFPAGGGGRIRGAQLKAMGLKSGCPDWLLVHGGRAYFIELKADGGRLSPAQRETHAALERAGAFVAVCRSIDSVIGTLAGFGIPTRAQARAA